LFAFFLLPEFSAKTNQPKLLDFWNVEARKEKVHNVIRRHNHAMMSGSRSEPAAETSENRGGHTILHVDDTEAQRYAISRILRHAGFEVLEARTGRQALEIVERLPDLVILDVNLPDISGFTVCEKIKANKATARIPVLHLSATMVSTDARVAGLEGGADAYLVQPVDPEELVATIRALLRVRKAEEGLWKSEQQYRLFFEANPLACWVFNTSDLRILAVNEAAVKQYGYSREEFTNLTLTDIVLGDESFARTNSIATLQSDAVLRHKTRSGELLDVEEVWAPLHLNGRDARLAIIQNITEKLRRKEAQRQEEMRRLLLEHVLYAQEEERRRIARELHDEAGQLMTSLLVGLRGVSDARQLKAAKDQAKALRKIASKAIGEVGRLARGLHSSVLDELGLKDAVQRFTDEYSTVHRIRVDLDFGQTPFARLDTAAQIGLYRIMQEALTNAARHAHASEISVRFDWDDPLLRLLIKDDGRGFNLRGVSERPSNHLGIEGMRQRASMLGGTLEIKSGPSQGTLVEVRVPLAEKPADEANQTR
jgi:PAS domain S-box-containing protein